MSRRQSSVLPVIGIVAMVLAACASGSPAAPTDAAVTDPLATALPAPTADPTTDPTQSAAPSATPVAGACAPSTDAGQVAVSIAGSAFSPSRIRAAVGEVIEFTNADPIPHTATLDDGSCTTPNLGNGASGGLVFDAPGQYPFHCRIHPDMKGTVEITG